MSNRQVWEYRVDPVPGRRPIESVLDEKNPRMNAEDNERLLNQRGAEGWELAGVGVSNFYFKRLK